jgi:hypothetical protein
MDVRNWDFLSTQLDQLGAISSELSRSGFAEKIAYTAFFWTLIQYHTSDDPEDYVKGAMSLPDHLTPGNRTTIEDICRLLDEWLNTQEPDSHPQYEKLRRVIDLGLQASTLSMLDPRRRTED